MAPFQYTPAPGSGGGGAASSGITTVGLVVPSVLAVAGSPLSTPGGTITLTLNTGIVNQFLAAPSTGNGQIGLRAIASGDIPTLSEAQISGLSTDLTNRPSGIIISSPGALFTTPATGVNSGGVNTVTLTLKPVGPSNVLIAPASGSGAATVRALTLGDEMFPIPSYNWTPRDIENGIFWYTLSFGAAMWKQNNSDAGVITHPQATGDVIGIISELVGGNYTYAGSSGSSPTLASDSTQLCSANFISANSCLQTIDNSKDMLNFVWGSGQMQYTFMMKLKFNTNGAAACIFDQNNGTTANRGVQLEKNANNTLAWFVTPGIAGQNISSYNTTGTMVINDTNWHYLIISSNGGTGTINLDGATQTFTVNTANSVSGIAPATNNLRLGQEIGGGAKLNAQIGDLFISNKDLTSQYFGNDITRWLNYNPNLHFNSSSRLAINGNYLGLSPSGIAAASGYNVRGLSPLQVKSLFDWTDYTNKSQMWTSAISSSGHGPTGVANHLDKVGYVSNNIGYSYLRDSYNTTLSTCPVWYTGALPNGGGCVYWSGVSTGSIPSAGENNLLYAGWPDGAKTWFVVACSLSTTGVSHHLSEDNGAYIVTCGPGYASNPNMVVQHFNTVYAVNGLSSAISTEGSRLNVSGWNILEVVQDGGQATIWVNGYATVTNSFTGDPGSIYTAGKFVPTNIGRPNFAGKDMWGWNAHKVCFLGALDTETRRRIRAFLCDSVGGINNVNLAY